MDYDVITIFLCFIIAFLFLLVAFIAWRADLSERRISELEKIIDQKEDKLNIR